MRSDPPREHREAAEEISSVRVAVLTISDTRTEENDQSGSIIRQRMQDAGHEITHYAILKDDPSAIRDRVAGLSSSGGCDLILTSGGTGIAPRDGTYEAISSLLERTLPGFGELFRMLSWEDVGAAAMLSRAIAGIRNRTIIFSLPGSSKAVGLALEKLILPEIKHLVHEMNR